MKNNVRGRRNSWAAFSDGHNIPQRILFVDDQRFHHKLLRKRLSNSGLKMTSVTSGELAVEEVIETQPDIVIMGGISGIEATQRIRRNSGSLMKPIIIGHSSENVTEEEVFGTRNE
jgi:CheY-like chemotaxis protein